MSRPVQSLVTIPSFGNHTVVVTATNLLVSTDPNSGQQSGAPTTVTFSLNRSPTGVSSVVVKKRPAPVGDLFPSGLPPY